MESRELTTKKKSGRLLLKNDPNAKALRLKASICKVLQVPEHDLFLVPHSEIETHNEEYKCKREPRNCLCLLNVGNQGFLGISQESFDKLVAEIVPETENLHFSWLPLGKVLIGRCFQLVKYLTAASQ
jgi:hypothetical protein